MYNYNEAKDYLTELRKSNADKKNRVDELIKFKERTGLKGQELKKAFDEYWNDEKPKTIPIKTPKQPKTYKEQNIMKGRSDLKKKGDKYTIDTILNVKKGLDDKVKRALKKSVIEELDKRIKGGAIQLDLSSDEEDEEEMDGEGLYAGRPRGRGRPRKNDIKTYGNILEHLVGHIKDPKEPIDKKDYKQAKEIIGAIEKKKRGRPRKVEGGKVDLGKALGIKPKKGSASYNARQ